MADLCLDEFTDHGHCGVLTADGAVDNDAHAAAVPGDGAWPRPRAGADLVGTSGMMDGQVGAVRAALDEAGRFGHRGLRLRGEVRVGVLRPVPGGGRLRAGRRPADATSRIRRTAGRRAREVALDIAEGADLVMVKPAMSYLDVLSDVAGIGRRPRCRIPGVGRVRDGGGGRGERLDRPATGRSSRP